MSSYSRCRRLILASVSAFTADDGPRAMGSKDKSREEEDEGPARSAGGVSPYGNSLTKEGGDCGGHQGFVRTWDCCSGLATSNKIKAKNGV